MRYDITLKTLFHKLPVRLLELLTGHQAIERLTVEYPTVQKRLPDLVLRLEDGRNYHLELQSAPSPSMPWRMLEYYWLIRRRDDRPLVQQVLYVGSAENTLTAGLHLDQLWFRYEVIDIRTLDGAVLLQSSALEDNILALLCRLEDERRAVRALLRKITQLGTKAREDALEQILILTGLRNQLSPILEHELQHMPITVDLMQNEFFRKVFEKGREEGEHRGEYRLLAKLLEQRFGPLPEEVIQRLQTAKPEMLERWGLGLLSARTLEEVFH